MQLRSDSFAPNTWLDATWCFARPDAATRLALSDNRNPHLAWSEVPAGTRSFALLCVDPEVPSVGTDVNVPDRLVPLELPRVDFFHWVLADLPADLREIPAGSHSQGITPRGKPLGPTPHGGRQGLNDYTGWFASDPDMSGDYAGYDGPCPPWNDPRVHAYRFEVFALDVERLSLPERFGGSDLRQAMVGHVLAQASRTGLYRTWLG